MNPQPVEPRLNEPFRLGDRLVTPSANEIDGVRIESKAMEVLVALAEAAPEVMSNQVLLDKIWPDVIVVDNVLYQAIAQLRKVLGDDARAPHYIETVPRRGYRVIATVSERSTSDAVAASQRRRPRHNLPAELTSFIGREREVSQVGDLLAAQRLVTVTGVGGGGKTRLALAVASARIDDFEDGVWLVELAAVTNPAQVEASVAKALGVREGPNESLRDQLLETLGDRRLLLVLDNCEHLIGACAVLVDAMLRHAPNLRILATSREAFGIGGEHPWRIQPLATPDPGHLPPLDELGQIDSVRLFTVRCSASQPGFALTTRNASAVADICSRLDGIPLAIELAAARAQTLSVEDISMRLGERFQLLTRGSRIALPRQRTLQATLDWSHALLTEYERVLLARLSVFAGGFTLAAAEAVGAHDPLDADDVLELLTRLVEQSMVQLAGAVGGAGRYRQLEPVRQYALERLAESGKEPSTRDHHRDYYAALAAELALDRRVGTHSAGLFPRFEAESDNFELALTRCLETDAEKGLQLAVNRYELASTIGDWDTRWLAAFLARTSETSIARHAALFYLALPDGDLARRRSRLENALDLVERLGERTIEARYRAELGNTLVSQGDADAGAQMIESALAIARDTGDANALGWCLLSVIWVRKPALEERATECIDAFRSAHNHVGLAIALYRLCCEGTFSASQMAVPHEWLDELIALARVQGNTLFVAHALLCLGLVTERAGDHTRAAKLMEESADLLNQQGLAHRARYEQTRR